MSDTPLVDAAAEKSADMGLAKDFVAGIWPLARQLERENAKLKADAERYRWLRDESWKDHKFSCAHAVIPAHGQRLTAAIDAARQPNTGGIDR